LPASPIITPESIAVTGAAGYVGSALTRALRAQGLPVIEFSRRAAGTADGTRPFRLEAEPAPEIFSGVGCLVHAAYDFKAWGWEEILEVNVEGTRRLFAAASRAGVRRFVLISTISAFPGCRSLYGRAKLRMEAIASSHGAAVVRPGLVFGDQPGGMVASLRKLASLPLVPLVGDGHYLLYAAHEEDLGRLGALLARHPEAAEGSPVVAAHSHPHTLREILSVLGVKRGRGPRFLPIPAGAIDAGLCLAESIGLRPRMRRDSLLSMLNPDPAPDFAPLARLGLGFRPFPAALSR
jgi:nucleoside-diphosphate-sugar epimerase